MSAISVSVAAKKAAHGLILSPEHQAYLSQRRILSASGQTGVQTITALRDNAKVPLIRIPYPKGYAKTYHVGSESPWRQSKPGNARLSLFRLDQIDFSQPWILTEGEWDALSAIEVRYFNTCSLPDGAIGPNEEYPAQSGKLWAIREAWPQIQAGGGPAILALDNDPSGDVTRDVLIDIFGRWRCSLIDWPEHKFATGTDGKCKDLNEILLLFGPDRLAEVLANARPIKLEGVFQAKEIPKRPPRVYYGIGVSGMDEHLKLFPGGLYIWTGHTKHGKTSSLLGALGHLAQAGLKIGLASFEADYWEDILPFYNTWLHGENANEDTEAKTHEWLNNNFVFISHEIQPLQKQASIEWIIQQAQDAKGRFGINVLCIDPWNKLQHKRGFGENETDYIGRSLAELRNYAQAYNAITIVSAHPTKESGKEGEIPSHFDIHGSMNWGNACDAMVIVYRPDLSKQAVCWYVPITRHEKKAGKPGKKWFTFSSRTNRYTPLAEHLIAEFEPKPRMRRKKAA